MYVHKSFCLKIMSQVLKMVQEVRSYDELVSILEEIKKNYKDKLVVVDCYASWCGPCKKMAPVIDELSEEFAEYVVFIKGDVEKIEELYEEFNVKAMPTFIFIKNMKVIDKLEGGSRSHLIKYLKKHI